MRLLLGLLLAVVVAATRKGHCGYHRKMANGTCTHSCLDPTCDFFDKNALEQGSCGEEGFAFTLDEETQLTACGPQTFRTYVGRENIIKGFAGVQSACRPVSKVVLGQCAQSCVKQSKTSLFGMKCNKEKDAEQGGFKSGTCASKGFPEFKGHFTSSFQNKSKCNQQDFSEYTTRVLGKDFGGSPMEMATALRNDFNEKDCIWHRRTVFGQCWEACIPRTVGFCVRPAVVVAYQMETGRCFSEGYGISVGVEDLRSPVCGSLPVTAYALGMLVQEVHFEFDDSPSDSDNSNYFAKDAVVEKGEEYRNSAVASKPKQDYGFGRFWALQTTPAPPGGTPTVHYHGDDQLPSDVNPY